jgi:hypothetical protein
MKENWKDIVRRREQKRIEQERYYADRNEEMRQELIRQYNERLRFVAGLHKKVPENYLHLIEQFNIKICALGSDTKWVDDFRYNFESFTKKNLIALVEFMKNHINYEFLME